MEGRNAALNRPAIRVLRGEDPSADARWPLLAWAMLAIVATIALVERLRDPLSSGVIGAEDPYTHIVYVKEHLSRGFFEPSFHLGAESMYPPGIHILVGALHALGGIGLYPLARFLPAAFGVLSVAGIFVVAYRLGGLVSATVAAASLAVIPEHIFRTNLLFPTALDLAIVPVLTLAAVEMYEGRWAWAWVAIPVGIALVIAHPWIMPLTTVGVAAFVGIAFATAPADSRMAGLRRGALVVVLFGALSLTAFLTRWNEGGESSFSSLLEALLPKIPLFVGGALLAVGALALVVAATGKLQPPKLRNVARAALLGVALWIALPLLTADTPRFVDYPQQVGWFVLGLAIVGLVLLPLHARPVGVLGAGLVVSMFPLTVIDFFDSPYWPHRTVAYVTLGLVLLAGSAAGAVVEGANRGFPKGRRRGAAVAAVAVGVSVLLAGTAVATAPSQFDWYRLYEDESFGAFEWADDKMENDPSVAFVSAHWKSNLYLKALGDMDRVHYLNEFYKDPAYRQEWMGFEEGNGIDEVYVLVDENHREAAPGNGWDLSFLEREGWTPVGTWGHVTIYAEPGVTA